MDDVELLKQQAVNPDILSEAGSYTSPRSFGVYKLASRGDVGKRYRIGNHPVRMNELVREYGSCEVEAIFLSREKAEELAILLNTIY
ncbi:MAG: hypothetical protein ABI791_02960 [Acidobacteriota bacterium]